MLRAERIILLIVLLGAGLFAAGQGAPAQAQTAPVIETLIVEIWPEFDRAAALVLINGRLPAGTAVPAEVSVRVPATAGGPHATAYQEAAGSLITAPFTTALDGDWIRVTLTVQTPSFHLEYYDPTLVIAGEARTLNFNWVSEYAAQAVTVRVQQPVGARDLRLEPAFQAAGLGDYGLNYFARDWGALAAGQAVAFTLQYAKSADTLSFDSLPSTSRPVTVDSAAPSADPALSAWLIGGLIAGAVVIVGGAGWFFWQRAQAGGEGAGRTKRGRRRAAGEPAPASPGPVRFCTQCGQPVSPGDRFCRTCGAPQPDER